MLTCDAAADAPDAFEHRLGLFELGWTLPENAANLCRYRFVDPGDRLVLKGPLAQ